ncbi:MAG: hydrogenase expression/formation protein HypD, partial [Gaiellaceae bacterium]|nr:hydrogenase expression/formation protein HypD [Gaiellaceae bacterium]
MCSHVTIVPPLRALLDSPDLRLDGFIGPGHVSTVVGARPFEFIPAEYGKPIVVAGFEPLDVLHAVHMILTQIKEGRCEVENQYTRVVPYEGNLRALLDSPDLRLDGFIGPGHVSTVVGARPFEFIPAEYG